MPTFVLVHGAWSDASAWQQVVSRLEATGHHVVAPQLPSHGDAPGEPAAATLDGYAAAVIGALEHVREPAVLVGHSMGGTVISTVAEQRPDAVAALVYVAAFLLPAGDSLYGFTQSSAGMATSALGPALRPGEGVLDVDPARYVEVFCADVPEDLARRALGALRPEPLAPLGTPVAVTAERWGRIPRAYVHTSEDRCVPLAAQREMVERLPVAAARTLATSHLPMLADPDALAAVLVELADRPRTQEQP